ncbi:MAG TPA: carboxypeptidase-like regulatory domain-containing protein [Bryobacteraceae bacterium]|nr:carboxypeptidase-like regulatory domain-containing protein [Bryobacteraceae bacterium]
MRVVAFAIIVSMGRLGAQQQASPERPLTDAVRETPADRCSVSGTVTDAVTGRPLGKVEIQADGLGSDETPTPFTTSDAHGSFTLVNLPPGQFRLKGNRNGYLEMFYGARRPDGAGTPIRLEPGQELDGLEFKLVPFGVIAGAVRDQDGEPLARAAVNLHRLVFYAGGRSVSRDGDEVRTDDQGQYRITGLSPGKYYVRAVPEHIAALDGVNRSVKSDQPPEVLFPALYPSVLDPSAARPVEVTPGARVTGIDITLSRSVTQRVTGHVTVGAGATLAGISLKYAGGADGDAGFEFTAKRKPNGDFEFPAVPPGSYVAIAYAEPPRRPTTDLFEFFFNQATYKTRTPVQVGTLPVENVQLALGAPAEVDGHVTVEGDTDGKLDHSQVTFDPDVDAPLHATVRDDMRFHMGLGPGHYAVYWGSGTRYVLRRVQLEEKDITEEGLSISGSAKVQIEIVVAKDGAQIEGTVVNKEEKPVAGATVVLVPEPRLRTRAGLFKDRTTDQSGRFRMEAVPPGTYKLFAWDDVEPGFWWDPDFLKNYEDKGAPLTLKPKENQSVKLHLVVTQEQ